MTDSEQAEFDSAPSSLKVAAVAMAVTQLLAFVLSPISWFAAASVSATLLVAYFVWSTRSRIAWILALIWAFGQIVGSIMLDERLWLILPAGITLVCLTLLSSRLFIWSSARPGFSFFRSGTQRRQGDAPFDFFWRFIAYMHSVAGSSRTLMRDTRKLGRLIGLVVASLIVLYPLVGVVYNLQHGSGRGSIWVNILWHVVWLCYAVAQIVLVIAVILAVYRYISDRRRRFNANRSVN
jgi:hypothetical protein